MIDEKRIKYFIEGAKEAFKEVNNPTFTFPMTILSAYELATSIEELLKEQEVKIVESIQMDRSDKWGADLTGYCPSCKRPLKNQFNQRFCGECGQAVKWE